jgi:hypothetical protein
LAGAELDIGLLINFGSPVTVKRKFRVYKSQKGKYAFTKLSISR